MINKDYILRMAERFGRYLAIIIGLRQSNKNEEALIYIDDLFLQTTGLTTGFINSVSEEMLLSLLSICCIQIAPTDEFLLLPSPEPMVKPLPAGLLPTFVKPQDTK